MKKMKRTCAILLTVALTLTMSFQPGIGNAFAADTAQTEQNAQSEAEPVTYEWTNLSDSDFVTWIEDHTDSVKSILADVTDKAKSADLSSRIDEVLGGDKALAEKLQSALKNLLDPKDVTTKPGEADYIYFDLAAGPVTIGKTGYSGYVYVDGNETEITGSYNENNKYYIYQSTAENKDNTGYKVEGDMKDPTNCQIPVYARVQSWTGSWTDYVTNNTNVKAVSQAWEIAAAAVGRTGTGNDNRITFTAGGTYNVTLDNIWATYQLADKGRQTGGITAHLGANSNTTIQLDLKGDNRVGNVHYFSEEGDKYNNQIVFSDGESSNLTPGSITVADFPTDFGANHWCSAIGGNDDGGDRSNGIVIDSGVIYAGTTLEDNCTAIGGGGNEYGKVTINNGTVTAVVSSTGTAIGGGIGYGEPGGDADVFINKGNIYAYNLGITKATDTVYGGFAKFVPAAAIGGGGSKSAAGNQKTSITIRGGMIYAQSMGGAAIGGGCSAEAGGGPANITITGGTIIAKSVGGKYGEQEISQGVSIGGGTGAKGGGSVILNVSGNETVLRTGSIGGGKCTGKGNIGSAWVTIDGGDITGQVIMAGGAETPCTFGMSAGKIHGTNVLEGNTITDIKDPQPTVPIKYLEENGGAVWMDDQNGVTTITGGTIERCKAEYGGAIYMNGGTANITGGTISNNTATQNGGGVYLPGGNFTLDGGTITGNTAEQRGGGIFLTESPTLTQGTISGNQAKDGGGICVNGDGVDLTSAEMKIFDNKATENGGGVAVLNGDFILDGGAVGVEGEAPNTAKKGGGVYVEAETNAGSGTNTASETNTGDGTNPGETTAKANVTVKNGNVWYNEAAEGGGIYLAKGEGDFTLEGETAIISYNKATLGGGVYLYKNPILNQGTIKENKATENGGGMYISDCLVDLKPTGNVTITQNQAKNGAGIYISGESENPGGSGSSGSVDGSENTGSNTDATTQATKTHLVGLLVGGVNPEDPGASEFDGNVIFTNNVATESGGAVCVSAGRFQLGSDHVTVTGNKAVNGGGVAVLNGNFTMTKGSIGAEGDAANTANKGGGVYVSTGQVWLKGGSIEYNSATDGGGAYVDGGSFYMLNGALTKNEAKGNGGGAYVAGDFHMAMGTIGGDNGANNALNGGGVYVNDGNVTVLDGTISHNNATNNGGGFYVSASSKPVKVVMLSGKLNSNQAKVNGGGMAVESSDNKNISVEIGCLLNHKIKGADNKPQYPIEYNGDYANYANYLSIVENLQHLDCPEVRENKAGNIGGGFYMNSSDSTLSFYCVEEGGNTASKGHENSEGMDVEGGTVVIGDANYHNRIYDDSKQENKQGVPWGYISMDNATLVNGGKVDIYGDMTNPIFRDEVTVDIEDKDHDHFLDHRRAKEDEHNYKVHYIENFNGTGLYQAFQYDEEHAVITIQDALFSHPGYKILGWYTKSVYNPNEKDPDHTFYQVGTQLDLNGGGIPQMGKQPTNCNICGTDKGDSNLLELYAIWEANGYTVVYNPNVPDGDTYTGEMEDQIHEYGKETALTENKYKYPGHIFKGWNTKADGSGTGYSDKQEVKDLTEKNGDKITLYAQWEKCEHDKPERWTYEVTEDKKTLRRICSCGGQTLTATLSAENTVYDGLSHPATLTFNDATAWGEDKPTITYTAERLKPEDQTTYGRLTVTDGQPFHAGNYTASITKNNGETPVIASVKYTIAKADQEAPDRPTYTVEKLTTVVINKLDNDTCTFYDEANKPHTAKAQYCLTNKDEASADWKEFSGDEKKLNIEMQTALTNYIVQARYKELEDYNASDITTAAEVYFFAGDVEVVVICDEGIECQEVKANGDDIQTNGITLTLETKNGYYLVNGKYEVKATLKNKADDSEPKEHTSVAAVGNTGNQYSVTQIPTNSILTINIGKTKKATMISAKVAPGQKFSKITSDVASISRDSAFTAAFEISNFDSGTYDVPNLTFDSAIPKDTTIILLEKQGTTKNYWYYRAGGEATTVLLTSFTKMGESRTSFNIPTGNNVDLTYQFIVDFSQSTDGYSVGSVDPLKMKLEVPKKAGADNAAPELNLDVPVGMADTTFTLSNPTVSGLTNSFTCTFTKGANASKWENRASALILTPDAATAGTLPADARIKAKVDGRMTYLYETNGSFIVPLSLLKGGDEKVDLTLESALFPAEAKSYTFTAKWLISPSKTGKAPLTQYELGSGQMIGVQAGEMENVTFTSVTRKTPSLKIMRGCRVLERDDTLNLKIEMLNMDDYSISADLLKKQDGGMFKEFGARVPYKGENTLSLDCTFDSGSYCLKLIVKEKDGVTIIMEVPYYFIIKKSTGS